MYLLDTNIISFLYRKNPSVIEKIKVIPPKKIVTCTIVTSELLFGAVSSELKKDVLFSFYQDFFRKIHVLNFDLDASEKFARIKYFSIKNGITIEDFDLMIASICLANNLTLVTNNTKHFQDIPDLKIEDWTKS